MPLPRRLHLAMLCALSVLIGSCGQKDLLIDHAVVRLSPVLQNPAALYFRIKGGPKPTALVDVLAPSALRTEMHEEVKDPATGAMTMKPVLSVPVPAERELWFKPGGYHVMVYGVNLLARRTGQMDLTFIFENGDRYLVTAKVVPAGAAG